MNQKLKLLKRELTELQAEEKRISDQYEFFQKEFIKTNELVREKQNQIDKIIFDDQNPNDWDLLLFENGYGSMEAHKRAEKALHNLGFWMCGYYQPIKQRQVNVMLIKNSVESFNKTMEGLKIILPHIKPLPDIRTPDGKMSAKVLGVFEHTCSESGVYQLLINEKKKFFKLMRDSWGCSYWENSCGSLEELIGYVQNHHWYSENENEAQI